MSVLTLILAGARGAWLSALTQQRSKPALPFGGKYRVIDFSLSNLANSNLTDAAVLAQYNAQSLIEHIGDGRPWGFNQQANGGIQVWLASPERTGTGAYTGTADAVHQNRKYIAEKGCEMVLILAGDIVHKLDYRELLRFHQEKGAELTILTVPVPSERAHLFGMLQTDENQRITAFDEKPEKTTFSMASMGMYVFNTGFLLNRLEADARSAESQHDFGRNIIPAVIAEGKAFAYPYNGYWRDIGSVQDYYEASMDLLAPQPGLDLFDPDWIIHTRCVEKPPAKLRRPGQVIDSLVSEGCIIEGEVIHSVLSPGVRVEKGAVVRDAVILNDSVIHAGAQVSGSILDKAVEVGEKAVIGVGDAGTPNQEDPAVLKFGISVVGKGARIPAEAVIERNCRVDPLVTPDDFPGRVVPAGSTVHHEEDVGG